MYAATGRLISNEEGAVARLLSLSNMPERKLGVYGRLCSAPCSSILGPWGTEMIKVSVASCVCMHERKPAYPRGKTALYLPHTVTRLKRHAVNLNR